MLRYGRCVHIHIFSGLIGAAGGKKARLKMNCARNENTIYTTVCAARRVFTAKFVTGGYFYVLITNRYMLDSQRRLTLRE